MELTPGQIQKQDILKAFKLEPKISYAGYYATVQEARDNRERLLMPRGISEVQRSVDWIRTQKIGKRIGRNSYSSYGFKHVVEKWSGEMKNPDPYVSNGAFLVACVIEKVPIRHSDPLSPNARCAIQIPKKRSLKWTTNH